jgi:RND family efflux transporter MFP subunit
MRSDVGKRRCETRVLRALAIALLVAGCGDEAPPRLEAARPVKILEIGPEGATRTLEYPGQVEAAQHAELGFEVAGRIERFPVDAGQRVAEGDVLASLDPRDFEAEHDANRAQLRQMQTEYERAETLFAKHVAPQQDVDRARRNLDVTKARLRSAEKALEDSTLRAPFAGVVARKLVKDFRNVQAKEPILILQDDSDLRINANIPERDWAYTRRRDPSLPRESRLRASVVVSSYPDRRLAAELREVATTADPATRTFAVTFAFDAPEDIHVLPGMTAKLSIEVPGERTGAALSIPARAVVDDGEDGPHVWRVDPLTLRVTRVAIALGGLSGDSVEITSGLAPGDQIAVSGVHQLRDGMAVRRYAE